MKKLIIGLSILAAVISCGPSRYTNSQKVSQPTASDNWSAAQLYYRHTDTVQNAWNDSTLIFHHWKEMADSNYLFSVPDPDSVAKWKSLCEEECKYEGYQRLPERYHTMNQYVTIDDISMRCVEEGSCVKNKDFILWRLEQFRTDTLRPTSLSEKFSVLQQTIDDLLDYQPFFTFEYNDMAGLVKGFQEFCDEMLFGETLKQMGDRVTQALKQEKKA